MGRALD